MSSINKRIGERIQVYRSKAGMSQLELGERANLHNTYISQIEHGSKNVSLEAIDKIITALGVSYEVFFAKINQGESNDIASECYDQIVKMNEKQQHHILEIIHRISKIAEK